MTTARMTTAAAMWTTLRSTAQNSITLTPEVSRLGPTTPTIGTLQAMTTMIRTTLFATTPFALSGQTMDPNTQKTTPSKR